MNHVSLFSGIGGIDLAAEWAGFTTVAQVEKDPYCQRVLAKHWPDVHRVADIKDFPDRDYGAVTLVSGGFPCQPVSAVGKRRGRDDDRWLWPEMLRVIRELRPAWFLAENVAGLLSMAQFPDLPDLEGEAGSKLDVGDVVHRDGPGYLDTILAEIEAIGYEGLPLVIPVAGVGAPHLRYRVFVVAHREGEQVGIAGQSRIDKSLENVGHANGASTARQREHCGSGLPITETDESGPPSADVAHTNGQRLEERDGSRPQGTCAASFIGDWWAGEPRLGDLADGFSSWLVEPDIPRVARGVKDRVNKLRALGNAVVPQQIWPILQAIAEVERA